MNVSSQRKAIASPESLQRIFTVPEDSHSTLNIIEQKLSEDLAGFLGDNIVAKETSLASIETNFKAFQIPESPQFVSDYTDSMMANLVAHSVHTSAPTFIGHMTSALPYFVLPLTKLMAGLNQNLVKIETSKAFTPLERQVLGMMHHLIYNLDERFYQSKMHCSAHSLGAFCSGGTVANMTALWAARNQLLGPEGDFKGITQEGIVAALRYYQYDDLAILTSERGHYSLSKAADLLGIGRQNIISIQTDENNKVNVDIMHQKAEKLKAQNIKVMAIVGVAGTTETGNIDPLKELSQLAQEIGCHFHVDAAWGGASLLSKKYRHLLAGIELADSVTIDAHKQMYVPMGAGMVLFKDPSFSQSITHHAEYILRKGSKDLGRQTLEGSRPGMAMLVHACLQIIGLNGYEILINNSIEKAHFFAASIKIHPDFELISEPELCILTYRYVPHKVQLTLSEAIKQNNTKKIREINTLLDSLTKFIQKHQREHGKSFVSRTRISPVKYQRKPTVVFRTVLANPLTSEDILSQILEEQVEIAKLDSVHLPKLLSLINE
ncbi:putative pyridoxal-dependent aspartate 1-decarboxylase [Parashewanella spongiae]|uniref:Putative pyridoxal-dependent aspartate 1-decarboxylase n=1 Tax=Parashewanella spongiae TaxID=342950 RepID=A0A3A6UBL1_9GAMM|nr:putative pyridoxal-dependent aspartate 1-decarboxylase [Parashewanella spongiae]MCL1078685.1 putative pyridoxal-dependent aspartate 1-decarboxylase [Parashewanella spongiae]RJY19406.1 putative pyridoxal-dependent aspartate 1-decarboxylase [Parashewanella spongiae]